jgi:hypothetical protein
VRVQEEEGEEGEGGGLFDGCLHYGLCWVSNEIVRLANEPSGISVSNSSLFCILCRPWLRPSPPHNSHTVSL